MSNAALSEIRDRIAIRDFKPGEPVTPVTELLHEAYASLAKRGFHYTASHQDDVMTERRLSSGFALVAEMDGVIVGTITLYSTATESLCEWYMRPGVYRFGQFGVRPDLQGAGIGSRLLQTVSDNAIKFGAAELALDTAEGATHLREWYERLGYRFVQYVSWPTVNYRSVILSRTLPSRPDSRG